MWSRLWRAVGVVCLAATLLLLGLTPANARKRNDALVREVNERWSGARCRLLFDIPVKRKSDSEGWSKSDWIVPSAGRKIRDGHLAARLYLSNRDQVPGEGLRAGTYFVAVGWDFMKPKSQDRLFLELRLEGSDARARIEFFGAFARGIDVDELPDMERWVRLDFFQIEAADERLVEVATPAGRAADSVEPGPEAAGPSVPVSLQVLGATTEPLTVSPGRAVVLALTYEVSGVGPGRTVDVLEQRIILRDGQVLTTLEASVRRGPGIHRSTQSLTVPAALAPGVLELRAVVRADGVEASGKTLFQVEAP